MGLMRSLKKLIDPHNILNPGKMGLDDENSTEQGAKSDEPNQKQETA